MFTLEIPRRRETGHTYCLRSPSFLFAEHSPFGRFHIYYTATCRCRESYISARSTVLISLGWHRSISPTTWKRSLSRSETYRCLTLNRINANCEADCCTVAESQDRQYLQNQYDECRRRRTTQPVASPESYSKAAAASQERRSRCDSR